MATLGGWYLNDHETQYGHSARLADMGCCPTSGANLGNASTGGKVNLSGDQVLGKVPHWEETDPSTLGWSIADVQLAMRRCGVVVDNKTGEGWNVLLTFLSAGHYVIVMGDSDQFANNTCSGAFNGDHMIGVHPATRVVSGLRQHWIDDPICKVGRWEYDYIIHRYAAKLDSGIRFAVSRATVPHVAVPAPVVTLRYGGTRLKPAQVHRIRVPAGQRANVRARPTHLAKKVATLANGQTFTAYQMTIVGEKLAGSRRWFGDRTGTRWLHVSAF